MVFEQFGQRQRADECLALKRIYERRSMLEST